MFATAGEIFHIAAVTDCPVMAGFAVFAGHFGSLAMGRFIKPKQVNPK